MTAVFYTAYISLPVEVTSVTLLKLYPSAMANHLDKSLDFYRTRSCLLKAVLIFLWAMLIKDREVNLVQLTLPLHLTCLTSTLLTCGHEKRRIKHTWRQSHILTHLYRYAIKTGHIRGNQEGIWRSLVFCQIQSLFIPWRQLHLFNQRPR